MKSDPLGNQRRPQLPPRRRPSLAIGTHMYRRWMNEVAGSGSESATSRVQIGHWSYSLTATDPSLQLLPKEVEAIANKISAMPDLYSSHAQVNKACRIIDRQMSAARDVIAKVGLESLPWENGWKLFQPPAPL